MELACAFAVQTAITHTRSMEEKYRVHAVAAAITSSVYAGRTDVKSLLPTAQTHVHPSETNPYLTHRKDDLCASFTALNSFVESKILLLNGMEE